jgi:3-hydroxybutyrate dehydrogenase
MSIQALQSSSRTVSQSMRFAANELKGHAALVTGSSSGIGLAIAKKLAAMGSDVMMTGIEPADQIEPTREALEKSAGVKVRYLQSALTQKGIRQLLAKARTDFGRKVDILVNNAGMQYVAPLETFPVKKWNQIINLNLTAPFLATQAVLKEMKAQGWGRIINIGSAHSLFASAGKAAYVSAKHGLLGLTRVTAIEGADRGVTCNLIAPGYVDTPLVRKQIPDQAKTLGIPEEEVISKVMLAKQPIKQFTQAEDVASLVGYLCTDAAKTITGSAQSIDGGWSAE